MRGVLEVAADHPAFAGHFPSFPVLPGAVLLDVALAVIREARGIDITAWQITSAKFLALVRPGDALTLEHESAGAGSIRFTILSREVKVAAGTLSQRRSPPHCAEASPA